MNTWRWKVALWVACSAASSALAAEPAHPIPDWHATVRQFARNHFMNPAWGFSHCERDYALARSLAAADHVVLDDDVLFAAAYLHDIAAFKPWGGGDEPPDHSDLGAEAVGSVLKDTGFPMQKLDAVRAAIRTHMYYRDPVAPEAVYLHDADALDWLRRDRRGANHSAGRSERRRPGRAEGGEDARGESGKGAPAGGVARRPCARRVASKGVECFSRGVETESANYRNL